MPLTLSELIAQLTALLARDGDPKVYRIDGDTRVPVEQVGTYREEGETRVEID